MDVIAYLRVSTANQRDEGSSLPAQRQRIEEWCRLHGHALVAVHADEGLSGGTIERRPGVQAAIAEACRRRCPLVCVSLSRLVRSTRDALEVAQRLDQGGAALVSLSEVIDTSSASGRLVFRLLAVLAEFERELIGERTTSVLHHLRQRGRRISGRIPFGFDLDPDGVSLVPNPVEQAAIARMRCWREEGLSFRAIAERLDEEGTPTKSGGSRWMGKVVAAVLQREWVIDAAA